MAFEMLQPRARGNLAHTQAIKEWVAQSLRLTEESAVMVTELRCTEPGCPPLETVIVVLAPDGAKKQYKLHKALSDVTIEDIATL
jgi:hypothetical protein